MKIGESSAFFTYVKASTSKSINHVSSSVPEITPQQVSFVENHTLNREVGSSFQQEKNPETIENHSPQDNLPRNNSAPESFLLERSCTPPISLDISQKRNSKELPQEHMHVGNDSPDDVANHYSHSPYPYYMSGIMNQMPMSSPSMYPKNLPDMNSHPNSALIPQYSHVPPHIQGMASYPYYPYGICLQPGQMPSSHPWQPSYGNSASNEVNMSRVDRREAALMKFRQKRKERCFDKKIRYVNRKKLAERRPRVKGQFVRKVNGVNVDLNGQPAMTEDDEEEEEEYDDEDQTTTVELSPEDDASTCP